MLHGIYHTSRTFARGRLKGVSRHCSNIQYWWSQWVMCEMCVNTSKRVRSIYCCYTWQYAATQKRVAIHFAPATWPMTAAEGNLTSMQYRCDFSWLWVIGPEIVVSSLLNFMRSDKLEMYAIYNLFECFGHCMAVRNGYSVWIIISIKRYSTRNHDAMYVEHAQWKFIFYFLHFSPFRSVYLWIGLWRGWQIRHGKLQNDYERKPTTALLYRWPQVSVQSTQIDSVHREW